MKRLINAFSICVLALAVLLSGACAQKQESAPPATATAAPADKGELKLGDAPQPVQQTVKAQIGNGELVGFGTEREKGETLYEAELKINGRAKNLLVNASGAVVTVEEEHSLSELKPALQAEIQKTAGKSRIVFLESVTKGGKLEGYEIRVQDATGKESGMALTATGKLQPKEEEEDEEDEKDEDGRK